MNRVEWKKSYKKIGKLKAHRLRQKCGGSSGSLFPKGKKFKTRRETYG